MVWGRWAQRGSSQREAVRPVRPQLEPRGESAGALETPDWSERRQGCHRDLKLGEHKSAGGRLEVDGVVLALKGLHKSVTGRPQQPPFQLVSGGPAPRSARTSGKK